MAWWNRVWPLFEREVILSILFCLALLFFVRPFSPPGWVIGWAFPFLLPVSVGASILCLAMVIAMAMGISLYPVALYL